jgi:hypothetical protein
MGTAGPGRTDGADHAAGAGEPVAETATAGVSCVVVCVPDTNGAADAKLACTARAITQSAPIASA